MEEIKVEKWNDIPKLNVTLQLSMVSNTCTGYFGGQLIDDVT